MSVSVTHIDERLDELERLRVEMTNEEFLSAVVVALCDVLNAHNIALVHPLNDQLFVTTGVAREMETEADRDWISTQLCNRHATTGVSHASRPALKTVSTVPTESRWVGLSEESRRQDRRQDESSQPAPGRPNPSPSVHSDGRSRVGCSLATSTWRHGGIIITWDSDSEPRNDRAIRGIVEAFAEITYSHYLETFTEAHQSRSQELIVAQTQLLETADDDQSASVLVSTACSLLPADRVCLLSRSTHREPRLIAVSGIDDFDRRTDEVKRIELAAAETSKDHQPRVFLQRSNTESGKPMAGGEADDSGNCICYSIPWGERHVLLIQWKSGARFAEAVPWLHESCQTLKNTWLQTQAWHRVPRLMRGYWMGASGHSLTRRLAKFLITLVLIGAIVVTAMWPTPFSIVGVGTLEPTQQRWVFASQDGFVRELHVRSGQEVRAGDPIATLESTDLQLRITEISGRIREVQTQREGIEISINQLVRSSEPDPALENRLQSELKELAIRVDSLNAQAALLESQRQTLQIRSPIDGTIVGWEIERNLAGRPIRRGDVLLRVADKEAPWRIELMVPDRDIGYVEQFATEAAPSLVTAEYVLRASPQTKYPSELSWISPEVVHDPLQGAAVETHLSVSEEAAPELGFGATVDGRLMCGSRPKWFVWGRPILEAIQRRLWF